MVLIDRSKLLLMVVSFSCWQIIKPTTSAAIGLEDELISMFAETTEQSDSIVFVSSESETNNKNTSSSTFQETVESKTNNRTEATSLTESGVSENENEPATTILTVTTPIVSTTQISTTNNIPNVVKSNSHTTSSSLTSTIKTTETAIPHTLTT
uniref:Uncharacterized protein n=1 Tax=Clytia hemisphaerica TaxID=252671 RepID=A0A7M6DPR0_9CNID